MLLLLPLPTKPAENPCTPTLHQPHHTHPGQKRRVQRQPTFHHIHRDGRCGFARDARRVRQQAADLVCISLQYLWLLTNARVSLCVKRRVMLPLLSAPASGEWNVQHEATFHLSSSAMFNFSTHVHDRATLPLLSVISMVLVHRCAL